MAPQRDEESGEFTDQYPRQKFIEAVEELEIATTPKVAEYVGCSYDLAYRRLHEFDEEGAVTKTDAGGVFIWSQ
ncbi:transcriptional regulator [Halomicrococcus gelatinilyticus]|uniref:transcriptional regulator n=1 Tax=Halomicrococcus gelatinilyticus TaxID=1702103 RepID=UPI002E12CFE1